MVWPNQSVKNDFVIRHLVKNWQRMANDGLVKEASNVIIKKVACEQFYRLSSSSTEQKELIS